MKKIILIGSGGHALSVVDVIHSCSNWEIVGFISKGEEIGKKVLNYPIIGSDLNLPELRKVADYAFVAIGQLKTNNKRLEIVKNLIELSFIFPIISSKFSVISDFSNIGVGTFVGHGAIINAGASIGSHCIINSKALIEHGSIIKDFCHISTGVLINGGVSIGQGSFVGSGAIIREGIEIPPNSVISAGKRVMGWPLKE